VYVCVGRGGGAAAPHKGVGVGMGGGGAAAPHKLGWCWGGGGELEGNGVLQGLGVGARGSYVCLGQQANPS
jgi:hypothetical protein